MAALRWPLGFMDTDYYSVIVFSLVISNSYCSKYLHKLFVYLTDTDNELFSQFKREPNATEPCHVGSESVSWEGNKIIKLKGEKTATK